MNVKKTVKYIISLAVMAALLYFSFRGIDWKDFVEGLKGCRWIWIVYAMAFSVLSFWIRSERWRKLLLPLDGGIRPVTTYNAVCIGYLANFAFPRIGEVVKCGVVSRRQARNAGDSEGKLNNFDKFIGTVVMEKTFDILSVFALFAILLIAWWQKFGDFFTTHVLPGFREKNYTTLIWIAVAVAVIAAAVIFLRRRQGGNPVLTKVVNFISGLWTGFKSCFRADGSLVFLAYTVALWLSYIMMSYCVIRSLPMLDASGMGFVDAIFVCAAGGLGWIIPAPGGIGAYHFIVALAMSTVYGGVTWEMGLTTATLNHGAQAVTMLACGVISYVVELLRKK